MEQNVHARVWGWEIQHHNQHEQNQNKVYHLMNYGNEEEVSRQNSNAFPLPEEGNYTLHCSYFMSNKYKHEQE